MHIFLEGSQYFLELSGAKLPLVCWFWPPVPKWELRSKKASRGRLGCARAFLSAGASQNCCRSISKTPLQPLGPCGALWALPGGQGQGRARAGQGQGRARAGPGQGRARPGQGRASGSILKASRLDFKPPGASGGFQACFGLPEQLIPGPENIKSGMNRAVRPPYGLKLFENVATGPRMHLEALNAKNL